MHYHAETLLDLLHFWHWLKPGAVLSRVRGEKFDGPARISGSIVGTLARSSSPRRRPVESLMTPPSPIVTLLIFIYNQVFLVRASKNAFRILSRESAVTVVLKCRRIPKRAIFIVTYFYERNNILVAREVKNLYR